MTIQKRGRICGTVGCNMSLEGRSANARYCKPCSAERDHGRKKARRVRITPEAATKQARERKSVDNAGHTVDGKRATGETHKVKTVLCDTCCGMTWRIPIRCKECGEWYAPEKPPERISPIGSSAGTAVSEGRLYGHSGTGGGHHAKR